MSIDRHAHARIETAAIEILTLTEGLAIDDLAPGRPTMTAITARLHKIAAIAAALPDGALAAAPEVNWHDWTVLGEEISTGRASVARQWSAATGLCVDTLQWIRLYRHADEHIATPGNGFRS